MSGPATRLIITDWSSVSPLGVGRQAFVDGTHGTPAPVAPSGEAGEPVFVVPDFTPAGALGRKGTRSMDRVTGLAVAAVRELSGPGASPGDGDGVAMVLGTTTGSAESIMEFARESMTGKRPFLVDPARFPNTVMNCAAGQCAIWYGLTGPNATIAGGRLSALHALLYTRRLIGTGRASTVLCGAAEEHSPSRSRLERSSADAGETAGALGEGCVILRIEAAPPGHPSRAPMAEVLGVHCAVATQGALEDVLAASVRKSLAQAGLRTADIAVVAPTEVPGKLGAAERKALRGLLPDSVLWLETAGFVGDTSAAGAAFQLATVLAYSDRTPDSAGRVALVTAVDDSGGVGSVLMRLPGTPSERKQELT